MNTYIFSPFSSFFFDRGQRPTKRKKEKKKKENKIKILYKFIERVFIFFLFQE